MGTLKLSNSSGNFVALTPPSSIASDVTLTLPNTDGDANQVISTNGSGVLSFVDQTTNTNLTAGTATTASGQYTGFDSIPSNAVKITFVCNQVSCDTGVNLGLQIGDSDGYETSGYTGMGYYDLGSSYSYSSDSTGWWIPITNTSNTISGDFVLYNTGGNNWVCSMHGFDSSFNLNCGTGGSKQLSGTLDRVRLGWKSGSFDNGTVRLIYEV